METGHATDANDMMTELLVYAEERRGLLSNGGR
jgi:hypothetical protein